MACNSLIICVWNISLVICVWNISDVRRLLHTTIACDPIHKGSLVHALAGEGARCGTVGIPMPIV